MLYRLSTSTDLSMLPSTIPQSVKEEISISLELLEREYGQQNNWAELGGYVLFAETTEDLEQVRNIINIDTHPCEWAEYVGKDCQYVVAVYQLNNDFGIDLYLPTAIAPDTIKEEL